MFDAGDRVKAHEATLRQLQQQADVLIEELRSAYRSHGLNWNGRSLADFRSHCAAEGIDGLRRFVAGVRGEIALVHRYKSKHTPFDYWEMID